MYKNRAIIRTIVYSFYSDDMCVIVIMEILTQLKILTIFRGYGKRKVRIVAV